MRRVMLLALLALVLPTAALANSISSTGDPTFNTGTFVSGMVDTCLTACISLTNPFQITIVGSTATITLTSTLSPASCGGSFISTCHFSGGTVTVAPTTGMPFTSPLISGNFMINGSVHEGFHFTAQLPHGGNVTINPSFFWNGSGEITARNNPHATVTTVIPEPGTLGLLGTGLFGLAGLVRRKRKFGT